MIVIVGEVGEATEIEIETNRGFVWIGESTLKLLVPTISTTLIFVIICYHTAESMQQTRTVFAFIFTGYNTFCKMAFGVHCTSRHR
jgi:hypothetical protein